MGAIKPDPQMAGVLKRLDQLAIRTPDLTEPIAFYKAVLPVLHQAQANVAPFTLAPEIARHKLETGQPILVEEDLPLDTKATHDLFLHLCQIIESLNSPSNGKHGRSRFSRVFFTRHRPDSSQWVEHMHKGNGAALRSVAAEQIRRAVEKNALNLPSVWVAIAADDWQALEMLAVAHQLDLDLLSYLAQNSLKPALQVWAHGLKHLVDCDQWRRGDCPFCGSLPLLSEIQGKEGERRLRCGSCGADWAYPRLQCAFCGNHDHKTLGHMTVTGEDEKYRLQTCDQCHGYLKVVVTFDPTPLDLLPVEDLATLHLDLITAEHNYVRNTVL